MTRGITRIFLTAALVAAVFLFANTLLNGETNDSRNFSRPMTPDISKTNTGSMTPFIDKEHTFTGQLKDITNNRLISIDSIDRNDAFPMLEMKPDPGKNYKIAELHLRQDRDYKIVNMIGKKH